MEWKRIPGIYWMHKHFWNAHSSTWDEATNTDEYRRGLRHLTALINERSSSREGKLLDLGCGTGNYSRVLAQDGWSIVALDLSPSMLARAKAKVEEVCPGQATFRQANFNRRLPVGDHEFQHAICIAALQCVGEPSFFVEVHRALKPSGYFYGVFRDNAMRDQRPRQKAAGPVKRTRRWTTLMHLKARVARTQMVTHWTEDSMRQAIQDAGLHVELVEPYYRGTKLIIAQRPGD